MTNRIKRLHKKAVKKSTKSRKAKEKYESNPGPNKTYLKKSDRKARKSVKKIKKIGRLLRK